MKMMKKILVCALAAVLILGLTACAGKCAHCGKRIMGKSYEYNGKVYCDDQCAGQAGLTGFLEDVKNNNTGNGNGDLDDIPEDDNSGEEIPELDDDLDDDLPEGGGDITEEIPPEDHDRIEDDDPI